VLITSNRDEKKTRSIAIPPVLYTYGYNKLLFPKDGDYGGSWIVAKPNGAAGVLLNGAFTPHIPQSRHNQSRGTLLLELMNSTDPFSAFTKRDMSGIEPFTLILYIKKRLRECRWTGAKKSVREMDSNKAQIWSSTTLYSAEVIKKRENWLKEWINKNPEPSQSEIVSFHTLTGEGDMKNDLLMNRHGETRTVSITSLSIESKHTQVLYWDALENKLYRNELIYQQMKDKLLVKQWWQRFYIRLSHWEYWPFYLVYIPIFFYWFWLSLKARSFFFFSAANPTICNSGFLMESKKEIYDLIPSHLYPTTIRFSPKEPFHIAEHLITSNNLTFPLIAKPDIGLQGMGVALLQDLDELQLYHQSSKVDYLVQAYVPYLNEVGIFYYRMPGEDQGYITGIVQKDLLKIIGDGHSTIKKLLQKNDRFALQIPALEATNGTLLTEVLGDGEEKLLVPFGNHSRGAKFIDATHLLDSGMLQHLNNIFKQMEGFHYGRLDIKYKNWEDLCHGKNFSIIELNGAGSEPTHIYDPKHSIFFAWMEIIKHLNILYKVSQRSKKLNNLSYMSLREGIRMIRCFNVHERKIK
jgi:hypothetical protein